MKITSLTKKDDFTRIFRAGKRIQSNCLTLFIKENRFSHSRFAFVAPLSVDKRAVIRNRLRRRAREYVRKRLPYWRNASVDAILLFKKQAAGMSKRRLYECFDEALSILFGR